MLITMLITKWNSNSSDSNNTINTYHTLMRNFRWTQSGPLKSQLLHDGILDLYATHIHICIYIYIYSIHIHVYVYIYIYIYKFVYTYTYICIERERDVQHILICVCVYIYIYIYHLLRRAAQGGGRDGRIHPGQPDQAGDADLRGVYSILQYINLVSYINILSYIVVYADLRDLFLARTQGGEPYTQGPPVENKEKTTPRRNQAMQT